MKGRIMTSDFLWKNRPAFIAQLCQEIEKAFQTADRDNRELVLNLNKYSDIPWERLAGLLKMWQAGEFGSDLY